MEYLRRYIPIVDQLSTYDRSLFKNDLSAGVTVGVMLIPQGMAYALIAGLPPIYGLYASLIPLVIYAAFGSSRQLAVGPVAMVSLLVAAGVAPLADGDVELYIGLALLLSLMVGLIQFGLGVLRAGFLTNFLSHPVLAGFTSAAALIIGFIQLKHLLGIDIPRSNYVHEILLGALRQLADINIVTLVIGLGSIAALVLLARWRKNFPGALTVVALTTVIAWASRLDASGVLIVGEVPGGLPVPRSTSSPRSRGPDPRRRACRLPPWPG
jgi:SulP family sulfate permease